MRVKRRSIYVMSFVGLVATAMALLLANLLQSGEGPFDPSPPAQSLLSSPISADA